MKTAAIVFPKPGTAELTGLTIPKPAANELLIEIEYSAVSPGTERWCLRGEMSLPDHPPLAFPHIPGYQAAGVVKQIGRDVAGFSKGDRVFSRACLSPKGWEGSWWGGHVGFHVADPERDVIPLGKSVSTKEASCLLLAQVGYNGAFKPPAAPGNVAVIIGDGLVGQFAAQALRNRGVEVILSGLNPLRLDIAKRFSADEVYDNHTGDFSEMIQKRFPHGVDIVIETASMNETVRKGIDMLKRHGHLVLNGFYPYPKESRLDWHWLRRKELTLHFPDSRSNQRLETTLNFIREGEMQIEELITHLQPVDRAPGLYQKLVSADDEDFLGIVFEWNGG